MGACCFDYDPPEFFNTEWRKARKEHKCCECGRPIIAGQDYEHIAGKWEGIFQTFKTCEQCADLRDSLMNVSCPALGDLIEEYKNFLDDSGIVKYDDVLDMYVYPENHLKLNYG